MTQPGGGPLDAYKDLAVAQAGSTRDGDSDPRIFRRRLAGLIAAPSGLLAIAVAAWSGSIVLGILILIVVVAVLWVSSEHWDAISARVHRD